VATRLAYILDYFPYGHASIVNELRILYDAGVDVQIIAKRHHADNDFIRVNNNVNYPVTYLANGDGRLGWPSIIRDNLSYSLRRPSDYATTAANSLRWHGSNFKLTCSFAKAIESVRPAMVYVNWSWANCGSTMYACRMLKLPFVFSVRGTDITPPAPNFALRVATARRIITPSEGYADILVKQHNVPREKTRVVPNSLDITNFASVKPGRDRLEQPVRLLSVGTLRAVKRYEDLIRCCYLLRKNDVNFQCRIFGDGPVRSQLTALVDKLGLNTCVLLPGNIPRTELIAQYEWCDIYVHTSQRESFCYAIVEAQASARCVIAADAAGGIRDSVKPNVTALLVPVGKPAAVADAILRLANDPHRRIRMGKAGRKYVTEKFAIQRVAPQLLNALLG